MSLDFRIRFTQLALRMIHCGACGCQDESTWINGHQRFLLRQDALSTASSQASCARLEEVFYQSTRGLGNCEICDVSGWWLHQHERNWWPKHLWFPPQEFVWVDDFGCWGHQGNKFEDENFEPDSWVTRVATSINAHNKGPLEFLFFYLTEQQWISFV